MTRLSINRPFVLVLVLELVLDWPTRFRGRGRGRARGRSSSLSQCAPTDASGLSMSRQLADGSKTPGATGILPAVRSEEHTSELQSQSNLVCRLLLEKKKIAADDSSSIVPRTTPRAHDAPDPVLSFRC